MSNPPLASSIVDPAAPAYVSRQVQSSRIFWFHLDPGQPDELTVVSAGYEATQPDYRIERDGFQWFSLEFVVGGSGKLLMSGQNVTLGPGVFFLYGPGVAHEIRSHPERPLKKYFLVFSGAEAARILARTGLAPGTISQTTNAAVLARAWDEVIDRGSRKSGFSHEICAALLRQILFTAREDAIEVGAADTRAFATYQRVRHFIGDHFLEITTLDGIARACDLDPAYLCRLFSRFQEETPYQHLTRLRMEHAATRLLEGGLAVKDVAKELGFSDPFHFSRVFKSVHRVPPSQFRRAHIAAS